MRCNMSAATVQRRSTSRGVLAGRSPVAISVPITERVSKSQRGQNGLLTWHPLKIQPPRREFWSKFPYTITRYKSTLNTFIYWLVKRNLFFVAHLICPSQDSIPWLALAWGGPGSYLLWFWEDPKWLAWAVCHGKLQFQHVKYVNFTWIIKGTCFNIYVKCVNHHGAMFQRV
jgi:hypothetical protein